MGRYYTVQSLGFLKIWLAIFGFLNAEKMSHQGKVVMKDPADTKGAELVDSYLSFSGHVDI
jgi:hypothetical protein